MLHENAIIRSRREQFCSDTPLCGTALRSRGRCDMSSRGRTIHYLMSLTVWHIHVRGHPLQVLLLPQQAQGVERERNIVIIKIS